LLTGKPEDPRASGKRLKLVMTLKRKDKHGTRILTAISVLLVVIGLVVLVVRERF